VALAVQDIADMIDHSLLRPELTEAEVREGCRLAVRYRTASVCARPVDLALAVDELAGTPVRPTTVIGFPHGSETAEAKLFEAREALAAGAVELDMVLNIGRLRSGDTEYVEKEIEGICRLAHGKGALLKVILENAYLDDRQKEEACRLSARAGADFVKTSTGFAPSGATLADLRLMRRTCPAWMKVKAAGGVRTLDDALAVRSAGASRFGATRTAEILEEAKRRAAEGTLVEAVGDVRLSGG
jgi:deoxyribose-phosphate aldolase